MENKVSPSFRLDMVSPCTKNWDKMTATEKGRFCKSCKKEVVNLVGLDEKEITNILSQQSNHFCGRVETKHLNSVNPIPKRSWFNRVAASLLITLGLTGLFSKSNAQVIDASKMSDDSLQKLGINGIENSESKNLYKVEGTLKDRVTGVGIPFASVNISSGGIEIGYALADSIGNFIIQPLNIKDSVIDILVNYPGYKGLYIKNLNLNKKDVYINLSLQGNDSCTIADISKLEGSTMVGGMIMTHIEIQPQPTLFIDYQDFIPEISNLINGPGGNRIDASSGPFH